MAKKYKIERNLILNDVKEGGTEDSVLVIDANNEVGSVARSEFGAGGNQNLQSVINNGGTAFFGLSTGTASFSLFDGINGEGASRLSYYSTNLVACSSTSVIFDNRDVRFINIDNETGLSSHYYMNQGKTSMIQTSGDYSTSIDFEDPIANSLLRFPSKPSGTYTLATTNDLTLQSVLTRGNTTDLSARFEGQIPGEFSVIDNYSLQFQSSGVRSNVSASTFSVVQGIGGDLTITFIDGFGFSQQGTNKSVGLNFNSGLFLKTNETSIFGVSVKADNSIAGILTLQTPNKTGEFTIATTDDIPTGLTQSITIGANTFTFTNGVLTDFETVEGSTGDEV